MFIKFAQYRLDGHKLQLTMTYVQSNQQKVALLQVEQDSWFPGSLKYTAVSEERIISFFRVDE
jgi:hypothetical protein